MIALPAGQGTYAVLGVRELVIANTVDDNRGSITPENTCKPHLPCFLVAVSGLSTSAKQTCVGRTPINPKANMTTARRRKMGNSRRSPSRVVKMSRWLVIGVCAALLAPVTVSGAQIAMTPPSLSKQTALGGEQTVEPSSTNLVDLLSADGDLSLFIRLLQRARLIPTLNKLHNATLFAPTNDAVSSESWLMDMLPALDSDGDYDAPTNQDNESDPHDNLNYRLRERLFYHMLNYTWTAPEQAAPGEEGNKDYASPIASYETTLLFPTKHEDHGRPGHVPYPEPEDTLLGGEGQKLAVAIERKTTSYRFRAQDEAEKATIRIGVDELAQGGAAILPARGGIARNGKLVVIDAILRPPKSLAHQIRTREGSENDESLKQKKANYEGPRLSRLASLLTDEMWYNLTERQHLTLFAPRDEAFDVLDPLEWKYLTSGFAADDILQIAWNHETTFDGGHRQKVGYLDRLLERRDGERKTIFVKFSIADSITCFLCSGPIIR